MDVSFVLRERCDHYIEKKMNLPRGGCLTVVIGLLNVLTTKAQFSQSPCPEYFDYQSDGTDVYGVIKLAPSGPVNSVTINVNFTIATRLPSQYVGRIEPINSDRALQDFNNGNPLTYRVHFPVTSPLPRLTALIVNDNIMCYGPGDSPRPYQYVTTVSLQHMLYLRPGSNLGGFQFRPRPEPDKVFTSFRPVSDNAVININDNFDDDRQGNWGLNVFVVNKTRPEFDTNVPHRHPVYPVYPEFPEKTTEAVRPQAPVYYPEPSTEAPRPRPQEVTQTPWPLPPAPAATQPAHIECGVVAGGNERIPLIYNGQSYERGNWPWLVAIYKRKDLSLTFICAGTLVSDRHVISAAHCMQQKNSMTDIKDIVVKVGVYNLEDWGDDVSVTRTLSSAFIHEAYNSSTLANDILVFTFERTVEFNTNIRPACLWSGRTELSRVVGASGVVAGWGRSESGPAGHGDPRMVRLPIVSTATCRASKLDFHKLTNANTLCAGDRNGAGPCLGDSGGGLYLLDNGRWKLRGVVSLSLRPSNGDNTCNLNEYIVFTDSAQYLSWINTVMEY